MTTVNEQLLDASIRHQVGLYRLTNSKVRELVVLFAEVQEDILFKLSKSDITDFSRKRLEALLSNLRELSRKAYSFLEERLIQRLEDTGYYETEFQAALLQNIIPVQIAIVRPILQYHRNEWRFRQIQLTYKQ